MKKMLIKFDYNNVDPKTISTVVEEFYRKFKNFKIKNDGEEIGHVEFGKVNLYLTLKNSNDNASIALSNGKGQESKWIVKNTPYKNKTNKELVFEDEENKIYIYWG